MERLVGRLPVPGIVFEADDGFFRGVPDDGDKAIAFLALEDALV